MMRRWAVIVACCFAFMEVGRLSAEPQLCIWEWSQLSKTKAAMQNPEPVLLAALNSLRKDADRALKLPSYSVTYNDFVPPSGDPHDYASFGAYWWPDPAKSDGLPYIRRDGVTNEAQKSLGDKNEFNEFTKAVEKLSLAYYYFEDEKYASHALRLINDWFLNPDTRMNPHLEYSQAVLGRNHGKNSGIIDTRDFMFVIESLELLKNSPEYTPELDRDLRAWFSTFLDWLRSSKHGTKESRAKNNHGSWFHAQAIRIALFVGEEDTARELLTNVRDNLIPIQIMPDGTQPEELARTNAFHYSVFNIHALSLVARMGESLGEDLWSDEDAEGRGLRAACEYVLTYLLGDTDWPHQQIKKYTLSPRMMQCFRMLSVRYQEPGWLNVDERFIRGSFADDHSIFLATGYVQESAEVK